MKKKEKWQWIWTAALLLAVILWFSLSLFRLDEGKSEKGRQQLEDALRKAAVACYAAEGIYPPDVAYLQAHYGVQIDESRYAVAYEVFADNLMPGITVLERTP